MDSTRLKGWAERETTRGSVGDAHHGKGARDPNLPRLESATLFPLMFPD